ncbi:hypothetical protein [Chryseobacterium koreense]|uniref:Uncharacterized protein n=1 Tax=Chryseobacterium koreense CCUG 49689 TaxID=1304281 RepID=A0A0J7IX39_9FLAO|nr:hypothetical protein [Chryseobacterium koreense]KMQ70396.1 hypothetical protein ACM44_12590 [Chryseobacterium koreense CCUG 49689]MBB5333345.1 hypothetical protein [Chryseobacterium koreense]
MEITLLFPWIDKCFFNCVALKATPDRDFKNAGKWNEMKGVFQISVSEIAESSFTVGEIGKGGKCALDIKNWDKKTELSSSVL